MEYWIEDPGRDNNGRTVHRLQRNQGPGFISELDFDAYMGPAVGDGCFPPQTLDGRRPGGHQLPESPPDSGSENPYSPDTMAMQNVIPGDYMLVHEHLPTHEILPGEYVYAGLKSDDVLSDVVVLSHTEDQGVDLELRNGLDSMYQNRYGLTELDQGMINPSLVALGHDLPPVYTSLQEPSTKKRKHDESQVKCEPAALSPESVSVPRPAPSLDGSEAGDDAPLQCIRFATFQQSAWYPLYDCNFKPLPPVSYIVGADKGFNFSQTDEAFVCQKKNHFQVTCQIQVQGEPHYVKCAAEGFKKINRFCIHFYGVKAEDASQEVKVEQSQSDRTKKPFRPEQVDIRREQVVKVTVGRLHFAETTNNNMRKKGRPNPDQRHFQLVVALRAHTTHAEYMIAAHASDRIIVRASNPGQFESDCPEGWWQRGVSENSVHFSGRVGINTDRPDECCVVNGNLKVMGHLLQPSDARAKHNIEELDTAQQLKNVQNIRVVKFNYDPSFAEHSGLVGYDPLGPNPPIDTGVIAQEVRRVLPEAVREAGDVALPNGVSIHKFLVVNKDRIFMENLGAVKELCKVTGHLESRIDQLERINKKLCSSGLQRRDSSRSSISNDSRYSANSTSSKSHYSDNISIEPLRGIARNIKKHECCHKLSHSHHSPKYTRKQCKNCHATKLGKYYNYNKVRYHSNKDEKHLDNPTYVDTETPSSREIKKKESCLWMRDDITNDSSRFGFCCRRKDYDSDMISNKFLQIIITILVFIMAVCLVVMSALYFHEHQELISMKEIRMHDKFPNYHHHGKLSGVTVQRTPDQNQIQNSKSSQHATAKKTAKEKGPHKTTQDYTTTTHTEPSQASSTTLPNKHVASNFVIDTVQTTPPPIPELIVSLSRLADVIGTGCNYALNTNNELDPECQSSCGGLDPSQAFENQVPLERSKPDKDLNETYIKPLEPEKNISETAKTDNDANLKPEHDVSEGSEDVAYSNLLDGGKNGTENARMKREIRKRETAKLSSVEMAIADQSKELARECDTVHFGVASKTTTNESLFVEDVCASTRLHNFTYTVPLSYCLNHKNIDITFRSSILKDFRLCDLHCTSGDPSKTCQRSDLIKPIPAADAYIFKMPLDCNIDRSMKIRAVFNTGKVHFSPRELCYNMYEPFVEYNIRIYRHCNN